MTTFSLTWGRLRPARPFTALPFQCKCVMTVVNRGGGGGSAVPPPSRPRREGTPWRPAWRGRPGRRDDSSVGRRREGGVPRRERVAVGHPRDRVHRLLLDRVGRE